VNKSRVKIQRLPLIVCFPRTYMTCGNTFPEEFLDPQLQRRLMKSQLLVQSITNA